MTLEEALTGRVRADMELAPLIGLEGGWTRRLTTLPELTFQIIADPRPQHYKGFQRTRKTQVQLDIWATRGDQARAHRGQLIALLVPADATGEVRFQRAMIAGVRSAPEPERGGDRTYNELYRESIDFIFMHNAI